MNKLAFLMLFVISSVCVNAQVDKKYLAGAVPEVDGKVQFTRVINTGNKYTEAKLFDAVNKWANDNYGKKDKGELNNKVLLSDPKAKSIACAGQNNLVFRKNTFVLDQTTLSYQLILEIENNECTATMRYLKYTYPDFKSPEAAEDLISDKVVLSGDGDKLNRYYDKFRTYTVDTINNIFDSLEKFINGTVILPAGLNTTSQMQQYPAEISTPAVPQPISNVAPPIAISSNENTNVSLPGFRRTDADKIPGNIIKMLANDWSLIASGREGKTNVMTASWGGIGRLWDKPVSICFINPTRYSIQTMDEGETYTISFYTEAYKDAMNYTGSVSGRNTDKITGSGLTPIKTPSGAPAFAEAWMIFECKKIVAQPLSPNSIVDTESAAEWSKDGYHKMYIGEILNVWIK